MILSYSFKRGLFFVRCSYEERAIPKDAGFQFKPEARAWVTPSPYVAFLLREHADDSAARLLQPLVEAYESSWATEARDEIPTPAGLELLPYQRAGVRFTINAFERRSGPCGSAIIADPMGLGKTIQAIATVNALRLDPTKVAVICPASLRLNWRNELDKWLLDSGPVDVILNGKATPSRNGPLVISYNLAASEEWSEMLSWYDWELVVFDEAHYLKNPEAGRTRRLLGDLKTTRGLVAHAKRVLLLTGTPIPNRPHEFYWPIRRLAPAIIDNMSYYRFLRHYMKGFEDITGFRPTGAQHQEELHARLRGSGWMVRRDKAAVLPQLPDKRYSMIVFPQDKKTAKIVEAEQQFSATEILQHGVPVGVSALPELRREMGVAKVPQCLSWLKDQLDGGLDKVLVFAHHTEVIELLVDGLAEYGAQGIYGKTSMPARQAAVDAFQKDPDAQVLVGSFQPMGVGWTLTAASDVVFVEGSWVPSDNEQAIDRVHRIGQTADKVTIYFLVIEGSLDARILGVAAGKAEDIGKVLDRNP